MVKLKDSFGFTLIEALIVMSIYLILATVLISTVSSIKGYSESLESMQVRSMAFMEKVSINDDFWFNKNGNINISGRFIHDNKECLVYLGYGRYVCE